jgi:hypothetical protein
LKVIYSKILFLVFVLLKLPFSALAMHNYTPVGDKDWMGPYQFSVQVKNRSTGEIQGPITFVAQSSHRFDWKIPREFPPLYPEHAQNRTTFYQRVKDWVAQCVIYNNTSVFLGNIPAGSLRPRLKAPFQEPLHCQLNKREAGDELQLEFNPDTGTFFIRALFVDLDSPTYGRSPFSVDIGPKLSGWSSQPLAFTDLQPQKDAVICVNQQGKVFKAAGYRRQYAIPTVPGTFGVEPEGPLTLAHYISTTEPYENAIFAAVFPKNMPQKQEEIWELYSDSEEEREDYFSESLSSLSSSGWTSFSETWDTTPQTSALTLYQFYEIEGEIEPLPVASNPFISCKKEGTRAYTRAHHATIYPVINHTVDRTTPYTLQFLTETSVSAGNDAQELRWTIYDANNLPISPDLCRTQPLSSECLSMNLKTLRGESLSNDHPAAYYLTQHPQNIQDFKNVFSAQDKHIVLDVTGGLNKYFEPLADLLEKSPVNTLKIYDTKDNHHSYWWPPKFLETLRGLSQLTSFTYYGNQRFLGNFIVQERTPFPSNIKSIEISELILNNPYSLEEPTVTFNVYRMARYLDFWSLPHLQKVSLSTVGKSTSSDLFTSLAGMLSRYPQLEELSISSLLHDENCPNAFKESVRTCNLKRLMFNFPQSGHFIHLKALQAEMNRNKPTLQFTIAHR